MLRIEYQEILDEAFNTETMTEDEKQWDWLTEIEAKLEDLMMMMRVSPEKEVAKCPEATMNKG